MHLLNLPRKARGPLGNFLQLRFGVIVIEPTCDCALANISLRIAPVSAQVSQPPGGDHIDAGQDHKMGVVGAVDHHKCDAAAGEEFFRVCQRFAGHPATIPQFHCDFIFAQKFKQ